MAITSANGCGGTALFTGLLEVGPADPTENKDWRKRKTHSPQNEIKSGFSLTDKSDDIVDICGTTSSNRACVWRLGERMGLGLLQP